MKHLYYRVTATYSASCSYVPQFLQLEDTSMSVICELVLTRSWHQPTAHLEFRLLFQLQCLLLHLRKTQCLLGMTCRVQERRREGVSIPTVDTSVWATTDLSLMPRGFPRNNTQSWIISRLLQRPLLPKLLPYLQQSLVSLGTQLSC